jgi:hypothetical protein
MMRRPFEHTLTQTDRDLCAKSLAHAVAGKQSSWSVRHHSGRDVVIGSTEGTAINPVFATCTRSQSAFSVDKNK